MTANEVNTDNWFLELMLIIMISLLTFCSWVSWKVDQDLRLEITQLKNQIELQRGTDIDQDRYLWYIINESPSMSDKSKERRKNLIESRNKDIFEYWCKDEDELEYVRKASAR